MKTNSIFYALILGVILASASFAQTDSSSSTISVSGSGEVKSKPDIATISIGVLTKGKNANEAVSSNSISTQKLLDTLRSSGVAEKDIQTSSINVYPTYKFNDNESTITGYQANNQITATIRKVSDVGRIIDSVSLTGNYTISGISFSIDDTDPLEADALGQAVLDARRKADIVAKAANVSITGVKAINVDAYGGIPFVKSSPFADAGSAPTTQVLPGDVSVTSSVSIQYLISK
jgi:uncharacterized protein YggE